MQANVNCEDAAEEKTRVTELKEKVKDGARWCLDANEPTVSFQITQHTSVLLKHFGAVFFSAVGDLNPRSLCSLQLLMRL